MEMTRVLQEDKEFKSQREDGINLSISGEDEVFALKIKTKYTREDKVESYKNKHYEDR